MEDLQLSRKQIADIVDTNPQNIAFWTNQHLIDPGVSNKKGTGNRRLYSRWNIADAFLVKKLQRVGISQQAIITIIMFIKQLILQTEYPDYKNMSPIEIRDIFWQDERLKLPWSRMVIDKFNLEKQRVFLTIFETTDASKMHIHINSMPINKAILTVKIIDDEVDGYIIELSEILKKVIAQKDPKSK